MSERSSFLNMESKTKIFTLFKRQICSNEHVIDEVTHWKLGQAQRGG